MDKRTKKTKDITKLVYFIAGITITGIGFKLDAYLKLPKWEDRQAKLINTINFKSPIQQLNIKPVEAKEISPEATTAILTKESSEAGQVDLEIIRTLESGKGTAGLAVTCKKLGGSNEYGYNPPKCYDSHEQLTEIVKNWFMKRSSWNLGEQLCYYNLGIKQNDCPYYQNYLKMKGGK